MRTYVGVDGWTGEEWEDGEDTNLREYTPNPPRMKARVPSTPDAQL